MHGSTKIIALLLATGLGVTPVRGLDLGVSADVGIGGLGVSADVGLGSGSGLSAAASAGIGHSGGTGGINVGVGIGTGAKSTSVMANIGIGSGTGGSGVGAGSGNGAVVTPVASRPDLSLTGRDGPNGGFARLIGMIVLSSDRRPIGIVENVSADAGSSLIGIRVLETVDSSRPYIQVRSSAITARGDVVRLQVSLTRLRDQI
jgi:hypothetical protein